MEDESLAPTKKMVTAGQMTSGQSRWFGVSRETMILSAGVIFDVQNMKDALRSSWPDPFDLAQKVFASD